MTWPGVSTGQCRRRALYIRRGEVIVSLENDVWNYLEDKTEG